MEIYPPPQLQTQQLPHNCSRSGVRIIELARQRFQQLEPQFPSNFRNFLLRCFFRFSNNAPPPSPAHRSSGKRPEFPREICRNDGTAICRRRNREGDNSFDRGCSWTFERSFGHLQTSQKVDISNVLKILKFRRVTRFDKKIVSSIVRGDFNPRNYDGEENFLKLSKALSRNFDENFHSPRDTEASSRELLYRQSGGRVEVENPICEVWNFPSSLRTFFPHAVIYDVNSHLPRSNGRAWFDDRS